MILKLYLSLQSLMQLHINKNRVSRDHRLGDHRIPMALTRTMDLPQLQVPNSDPTL